MYNEIATQDVQDVGYAPQLPPGNVTRPGQAPSPKWAPKTVRGLFLGQQNIIYL